MSRKKNKLFISISPSWKTSQVPGVSLAGVFLPWVMDSQAPGGHQGGDPHSALWGAQGIWVTGIHSCVSPIQGLRWAEEALGIRWGGLSSSTAVMTFLGQEGKPQLRSDSPARS